MANSTKNLFRGFAVVAAGLMAVSFVPAPAQAGRWDFSINIPFHSYPRGYGYRSWTPRHFQYGYYPVYNPVVQRDVYQDGHGHYDGTVHRDTLVEDRHASYYSPGRNEAITRPRTTVRRRGGLGFDQEQERTSWIGADGRPHSTTITRTTTQDPWGNSRTDTHVSLKNKQGSDSSNGKGNASGKSPKEPEKVKAKKR
jgi:hypothetical protein